MVSNLKIPFKFSNIQLRTLLTDEIPNKLAYALTLNAIFY